MYLSMLYILFFPSIPMLSFFFNKFKIYIFFHWQGFCEYIRKGISRSFLLKYKKNIHFFHSFWWARFFTTYLQLMIHISTHSDLFHLFYIKLQLMLSVKMSKDPAYTMLSCLMLICDGQKIAFF
jgi:hypothetical protein